MIWPGLGWPLLAGGRCSEVAVNSGLTVIRKKSKSSFKEVLNSRLQTEKMRALLNLNKISQTISQTTLTGKALLSLKFFHIFLNKNIFQLMFSANQMEQVGENQLQLSALAKKKKKRNRPLANNHVNNF
jgi:hypothetical protein